MSRLRVEVRDVRLVATVAEMGGLTRAARRLHLTPSALSHQLRLLENRLGAKLFERFPRRMPLTPSGERLLRAGIPLLRELRRAEEDIAQLARSGGGGGILRISTESYTSYHWLPPLLRQFQREFPAVEVQIRPERLGSPLQRVRDGELDLAILQGPVAEAGIKSMPLFRDELVVIVPREHAFARRAFVEPDTLSGEHLILYPLPAGQGVGLRALLREHEITPSRVSRVPLTELIVDLVSAGLGVSILPRWAVPPRAGDAVVRAIRLTRTGVYREWYAAYRDRSDTPGFVHGFVELLFRRPPTTPRPARQRK